MMQGIEQREAGREALLPDAELYIPKPLRPEKGEGSVRTPLPGKVILFDAREGQRLKKGHLIAVVEAMKMENEITAPFDGLVTSVSAGTGDTVKAGQILAVIEGEEA